MHEPKTLEEQLAATPLSRDVEAFISKYGLDAEASEELSSIFSTSYKSLAKQLTEQSHGPTYRWDQVGHCPARLCPSLPLRHTRTHTLTLSPSRFRSTK